MADGFKYTSATAVSSNPFPLFGGRYAVGVVASNFGTIKLQALGPDGSTYIDIKAPYEKSDGTGGTEDDLVIGTFGANGYKVFDLAPGQYRFTVGSATSLSAVITRVPLSGN